MKKNVEKKSGWGGSRTGAGRKRTMAKRYGFNAPADVAAILDSAPNKSDFIVEAIRFYAEQINSKTIA